MMFSVSRRLWGAILSAGLITGMLSFFTAGPAAAATFAVNSTADTVDVSPGDGSCADVSGDCTLRAAVMEANSLVGPDIINVPAGTYTLTIPGAGEDLSTTGDLDVIEALTIQGAGADVTSIDAGGLDSAAHILAPASLDLLDVELTGDVGLSWGIVTNEGDSTMTRVAVRNMTNSSQAAVVQSTPGAALAITRSAFVGNDSPGGDGGAFYLVNGSLDIAHSEISDNTSCCRGAGIAAYGASTTVDVFNTTISNNTSSFSGGGSIYAEEATVNLTHATVIDGSIDSVGPTGGNLMAQFGGTINVEASIVAEGTAGGASDNCDAPTGTINSLGNNLEDTNDCGFASPGDITSAGPQLGVHLAPLALNGDPLVRTHELLSTSAAIDAFAAPCAGAATDDQRNQPRPIDYAGGGAFCDIGAYEATPSSAQPTTTTAPVAPTTTAPTIGNSGGTGLAATGSGRETNAAALLALGLIPFGLGLHSWSAKKQSRHAA